MAQRDLLKSSLDAGREVTQRTQDRLETLVRDLARTAEDQAAQAQQLVQELVERSRTTTEQVIDVVDRELRAQVNALGLATRADIDRLERRVDELQQELATRPAAPTRKAAKKGAGKKSGAKEAAKKAAAHKAVPAKTSTRRATATVASRPTRKAAPGTVRPR